MQYNFKIKIFRILLTFTGFHWPISSDDFSNKRERFVVDIKLFAVDLKLIKSVKY